MTVNAMDEVVAFFEKNVRSGNCSQKIALRSRIILQYLKRKHTTLVANDLGIAWNTAKKWINRWKEDIPSVINQWIDEDFDGEAAALKILEDKARSGTKKKFTPEQKTMIISLACQKPSEFGLPFTHWTLSELVKQIVREGIAPSISPTTVGDFLKSGVLKTP